MDRILAVLTFIAAIAVIILAYPDGFTAVILCAVCAAATFILISKSYRSFPEKRLFLQRIFICGLLLRLGVATLTYFFQAQNFFGGDATTYDLAGNAVYTSWFGNFAEVDQFYYQYASRASGSGWGMSYIVAAIYSLTGRNAFATQLFNCVLGAATACLIYNCAQQIFRNSRVSKTTAILVAIFPSLILWSSQGLKDGIICFLLALAMSCILTLKKEFSYQNIAILLISLFGIYTLRFYIFFALAAAILGTFLIDIKKSPKYILRQVGILVVVSIGLTYLGLLNNAQKNIETYGSLERLEASRKDLSVSAESGYGDDLNVSTPIGVLKAIPIGFTYFMFAPFPWQITNFRQAITLPEMLLWWSFSPLLISGIWYTIRNKLNDSMVILLFTLLLTLAYSVFQGNVGTAYRMRAQMLIFYFVFVAVGWEIFQEKRENRKIKGLNRAGKF